MYQNSHKIIYITFLLLLWVSCVTTTFAALSACDEINGDWHGIWEQTEINGKMCQWVTTMSAFNQDEMIRLDIKLSDGIDNSNRSCSDRIFVLIGTCRESKLRVRGGGISLKGGISNDLINLYGDHDWLYLQKR